MSAEKKKRLLGFFIPFLFFLYSLLRRRLSPTLSQRVILLLILILPLQLKVSLGGGPELEGALRSIYNLEYPFHFGVSDS